MIINCFLLGNMNNIITCKLQKVQVSSHLNFFLHLRPRFFEHNREIKRKRSIRDSIRTVRVACKPKTSCLHCLEIQDHDYYSPFLFFSCRCFHRNKKGKFTLEGEEFYSYKLAESIIILKSSFAGSMTTFSSRIITYHTVR